MVDMNDTTRKDGKRCELLIQKEATVCLPSYKDCIVIVGLKDET